MDERFKSGSRSFNQFFYFYVYNPFNEKEKRQKTTSGVFLYIYRAAPVKRRSGKSTAVVPSSVIHNINSFSQAP